MMNWVGSLVFIFSLNLLGANTHFHLPLGASSEEYVRYLNLTDEDLAASNIHMTADISDTVNMGQRLLAWIKKYNANNKDQVRLSNPNQKRNGYPIDSPSSNGDRDIKRRLKKLRQEAPQKFINVVDSSGKIPSQLLIAKDEFIKWGRKVDSAYSMALRWRNQKSNLYYYRSRKKNDVSGYWFLSKLSNRKQKLRNYNQLTTKEKREIKSALVSLCQNSGNSLSQCRSEFNSAKRGATLNNMYRRHRSAGKRKYDSYFNFYHKRSDLRRRGRQIILPFQRPKSTRLANWFKTNIEKFWQAPSWFFQVRYSSSASAHASFRPDVVPHVSGGNHIVLNSRDDIREYSVKWTLAHEIGHILGFKDCYLEFYDDAKSAMIYYEIDTSNIMCSRAGQVIKTTEKTINHYYP